MHGESLAPRWRQLADQRDDQNQQQKRKEGCTADIGIDLQLCGLFRRHLELVLPFQNQPSCAIDPARQRQNRNSCGQRQQRTAPAWIPGLQPQPEMNADAAMQPDEQKQQALGDAGGGPKRGQLMLIVHLRIVDLDRATGHVDVPDQQIGNGQAQQDLYRFPDGHPEGAPGCDAPQGKPHMHGQCAVKRHCSRP